MRVYIETYGCSSNTADAEMMAGLLKKSGFDVVDNPENPKEKKFAVAEIVGDKSRYLSEIEIKQLYNLFEEKKTMATLIKEWRLPLRAEE